MDEEAKPVTSVGHGLPSELQDLRKDKPKPEPRSRIVMDARYEGLAAKQRPSEYVRPESRPDPHIELGKRIGEDVRRESQGKAKLPNFRVSMSSVKPDGTTDDRLSMRQTIDAKDGIAVTIWQKGSDGTHRLVLSVTGLPNDKGDLVMEVRTKDSAPLPIYSVTTRPAKMEV